MRKTTLFAAALAAVTIGVVVARASDRVAVYAKVDRVVLEPNTDAPNTIQVWGVFSIAQSGNPNDYQPPARGYLYYQVASTPELARKEWSDLKSVAGTATFVAFGSRWEGVPHLRQANDPPAKPDPYTINAGLIKVQGKTDYAPIRALVGFNR